MADSAATTVATPLGKRTRAESAAAAGSSSSQPRLARVRFSHVTIQEHGTEVWGGGGKDAAGEPVRYTMMSLSYVNKKFVHALS